MENVLQFIANQSFWYTYLILFILIFMENTLPILPGDAILIFSAYLAGNNALNPLAAYLITVTGSISGFIVIYLISHHWGRDFFERRQFSFFPSRRIKRTDHYFHKFGNWVLIISRLIPGTRLMIAMIAGFTKIRLVKAILLTLCGILIWNGLIYGLAIILGDNWEEIKVFLREYSTILNIALIILLILFIVYRIRKKKNSKETTEID
ncbi:MAG: hypothetical protein COT43_01690 [Candidatus Marinimicrobia bacterium CG08_land_8_20_14_0_20_45_22]|nr:MAG: hypothetical protein COT43_01690 [Candidatus Marinimicrobia bacterium CG08_land_8_20_14_0_20_45_22]